MKNLLARLKAFLPDEMERSIRLKSIQWSWLFSLIFLMIWMLSDSHQTRTQGDPLNLLPGLLLNAQLIIVVLCQLVYRARLLKGSEDEGAVGRRGKILVVVLLAVILIAALGFAVMLLITRL